jgi:hypothetical protein
MSLGDKGRGEAPQREAKETSGYDRIADEAFGKAPGALESHASGSDG